MDRHEAVRQLLDNVNNNYSLIYKEEFDGTHSCSVKLMSNNCIFELFETSDIVKGRNLYKDFKRLYEDLPEDWRNNFVDELFDAIKTIQIEGLKHEVNLMLCTNMRKKDIYDMKFSAPDSTLDEAEIFSLITEVLVNHEKNNN